MADRIVLRIPSQFPMIQPAIDSVAPGQAAIIEIEPGRYLQPVVMEVKEKRIRLQRVGEGTVQIDADPGADYDSVLKIEKSSVEIAGIKINGANVVRGIEINDAFLEIEDCEITNGKVETAPITAAFGGIIYARRCDLRLRKSTFAYGRL